MASTIIAVLFNVGQYSASDKTYWLRLELYVDRLHEVHYCSLFVIHPTSTKLKGGYAGFTLSVCPSVDRVLSALYLQQYWLDSSDFAHLIKQFQKVCWVYSLFLKFKNLKFLQSLLICNFFFVFFWLGIQYDSIAWVIMKWRGYPQKAGILAVLVALIAIKDLSMMYCALWDWRHKGARSISQCMRSGAPNALTYQ